METITFFYLLAEDKKFNFAKVLNPYLDDVPHSPPKLQKNKKPSFKEFFSSRIFRTDSYTAVTAPPIMNADNIFPLFSEHIQDLGLYYLVQNVVESWFSMLFSNVLRLKDNLTLWDQLFMHGTDFLYQFGLAFLNRSDSKLSSVIKEERELYNKKDIEDPQIVSLYIISSLKKLLITPLTHKEFLSVLNTANENTFEVKNFGRIKFK